MKMRIIRGVVKERLVVVVAAAVFVSFVSD